MSKQSLQDAAFWVLAATLLVACGGCVSIPTSPAAAISPTSPCPSLGTGTQSLATPQPTDLLLELAWEGGLTRPELAFAFGRVPEFSLLPDGSAYYLDPPEWDKAQVMAAHLAPDETEALMQRVLELGFERLESYTDPCQPQPNGTCLCVADAGESVLRVRLPSGELREVRNYYDFANDPEALLAIRTLLQDDRHPQAQVYQPAKAALFIRPVPSASELAILDWPLPPSWLAGGTPDAVCVRTLAGTDLRTLLAVTGRNLGDFYFRAGKQVYNVYLAPWLPGVDYADLITSSGQACPPAEEPADQGSSNVQPTPSATSTPYVLRIGATIDGRSQLVLQGDTVHWHHLEWAAPGRHLGADEPTYLNGAAWYPIWPDHPDTENRDCGCDSSKYVGVSPLLMQDQTATLEPIRTRDKVAIVQQPEAANSYTLIVEFDDNVSLGSDWYEVDLSYLTDSSRSGGLQPQGQPMTPRPGVPTAPSPPSASDPYDGWHEYTNLDYGFAFRFPPDWALEERPHRLILRHKAVDTLWFTIAYRRATEDVESSRTGMPAGDFVTRSSVPCLGREISRDVLVYEGKDKLVLYNYSSAIPWGDLVFGLILEDMRSDYETVDLPEDVQRQIDQVVTSLALGN